MRPRLYSGGSPRLAALHCAADRAPSVHHGSVCGVLSVVDVERLTAHVNSVIGLPRVIRRELQLILGSTFQTAIRLALEIA